MGKVILIKNENKQKNLHEIGITYVPCTGTLFGNLISSFYVDYLKLEIGKETFYTQRIIGMLCRKYKIVNGTFERKIDR